LSTNCNKILFSKIDFVNSCGVQALLAASRDVDPLIDPAAARSRQQLKVRCSSAHGFQPDSQSLYFREK
jgi:hypothetical protein